MHTLTRHVRFSISPFLPQQDAGSNAFASKPSPKGLSMFFELAVELTGEVEQATGFVVNVSNIDEKVREFAVPVFAQELSENFERQEIIGLAKVAELLGLVWEQLADRFGRARLTKLSLKLDPFRTLSIDSRDFKMVYFTEKFEFSASHTLWNNNLSEQRNLEVFGKCAHPTGHGHNYVLEVTVGKEPGRDGFCISELEETVDQQLIEILDHKNLNVDIAEFKDNNPTVENIAVFAWNKLADKFGQATLHCVKVWETERTYCTYFGRQPSD